MKFSQKILVYIFIGILSATTISGALFSINGIKTISFHKENNLITYPLSSDYEQYSQGNFSGVEFSSYNLSVFLDEDTSTVAGNLTVDFYNNDPINFSQIPFHIFASGMRFDERPGYIEILNITTLEDPKKELAFDFLNSSQLMWVNLTSDLEPENRISFIISFNTTLPDGNSEKLDRAGDYGWDHNKSRIFKFAACYPLPCVYDEFDGWNIDPYLLTGDPFYYDMAYYDFIINVPEDMVVAATGELLENMTTGGRTIYHYNPQLPVREVTFSASRYFEVESFFIPDANITVSTYFLNHSDWLWVGNALTYAVNAGSLYYDTLGIYPYSTFNVVQEYTNYGGMEYPLQVYVSTAADTATYPYGYLESVIAHETAHQWFYNLVGIDEVDWGFLDEGIVCWLSDWYINLVHPEWGYFDPYYWGLYDVRHYSLDYGLPNKINQSIPECFISETDYWYLGYTKTNTILEKLRQTINHTNFIEGLTYFFQDNYFEIGDLTGFQNAIETVVESSLDWFFFPWFDNPYLPKYNFTSIIYDENSKKINITIEDVNKQLNQYDYSQQIPVNIYDSNSSLIYSDNEWINGTTSLLIQIDKTPHRVVLDYNDFVLVQFSDYNLDYIETTDITIVKKSKQQIPGYNIIFILLTFGAVGLIKITKKPKFLRLNNSNLFFYT
ncbi:MAG: M1 family metallopeptidase [Promethearchaeota archaeon]